MWRVTAFLKRKAALDRKAFVQHVETLLAAIAAHDAAPEKTVLNLPMDPLSDQMAAMFGDGFDAVVELHFTDSDAANAALFALAADAKIAALADAAIDRAGSHAWLAEIVPQIVPPAEHLTFFVAGQIADGMTRDEAQQYWRSEHVRVFTSVPDFIPYIVGYTQLHGRDVLRPGAIDWLAAESFYPMCADMGLRSTEDVVTAYSMPSYLAIVRPDEERFSKPADMLSFASGRKRIW